VVGRISNFGIIECGPSQIINCKFPAIIRELLFIYTPGSAFPGFRGVVPGTAPIHVK
jgi:hypothetical protein